MNQTFKITVTDEKGKTTTKRAEVGGGNLTPETLREHYIKAGVFKNAKNIEIVEITAKETPSGTLNTAVDKSKEKSR